MEKRHALALAGLMAAIDAHASCGATFCTSSNDWLGLAQGWRVWGQMEYIDQSQLREGGSKISPAATSGEPHTEIKTLNRNLLLGAEYGFARNWSVEAVLPYSNREHLHVANAAPPESEKWDYDELGDARVKLRYQPDRNHTDKLSWGLNGGLKLPTGKTDLRNAGGALAERSMQPGTGTTDLLLAGGLAWAPSGLPGRLFTNLNLQLPLNENDGYRPGWRTALQVGWQYPLSGSLDLLLQANLLRTGRDRGANAEPAETGRREAAIAPGLAYAWSRNLSLHAQVELPVYQKVNGIQLTHDYAFSAGFSLALD